MPDDATQFLTIIPGNSLPTVNHPVADSDLVLRRAMTEAYEAWLGKSPSRDTRSNYQRDIEQFLVFAGVPPEDKEKLCAIRPLHVNGWRDHLQAKGLTNSSIRRKLTAVRSLFSYLQSYGYTGKNPADGRLAQAPAVPRDGKTVGLSPENCRLLLDAPKTTITRKQKVGTEEEITLPAGVRDRAMFSILAFTGCRVGELTRLKVGSYKSDGVHKVLEIHGKGGKERLVPLHKEAEERLEAWLDFADIRGNPAGALFRPANTARGNGKKGFAARPMTRRAVQKLVERYVRRMGLDPNVTVHSFRVTALTTARERGSDIIDLQAFAGHADPRTTLTYIRSRDRLSNSPAYVLKY
jgi:integrase/recombinase XerD